MSIKLREYVQRTAINRLTDARSPSCLSCRNLKYVKRGEGNMFCAIGQLPFSLLPNTTTYSFELVAFGACQWKR